MLYRIDIQEFKTIPTDDYRLSKALHIYHKYIKPGAILEIGGMSDIEKESYIIAIETCKDQKESISTVIHAVSSRDE